MTPWVMRLLAANVVMFFLSRATPGLVSTLALVPALVPVRPWTPFTYMFLHADFFHLLFNMLGLYFFGPRLEDRIGSKRFFRLYMISGLAGALASIITPHAAIIGASGAVFGVFVGFARYWPRAQVFIWGILPVEARILVILMTVLALLGGIGVGGAGIAHFAHLGGFVGGWLYLRAAEARAAATAFRVVAAPPVSSRPDVVARWRRIDRAALHPINAAEVERVLSKLEADGPQSLSEDERAFLDRFAGA